MFETKVQTYLTMYVEGGDPPQPQSVQQPTVASCGAPDTEPPNSNNLGKDSEVKKFHFTFQELQNTRDTFLAKVYSIVTCQLLVTAAIIDLFVFHQPVKIWVLSNIWPVVSWTSFAAATGCVIIMPCVCGNLRRMTPVNYILLGIFTMTESFFLGVFWTVFAIEEFLVVVCIMAVVCLALTIFALQTKWDFNTLGAILLCTIVILLLFHINVTLVRVYKIMVLVYASLCALLFSIALVCDTQLMVNGKHKNSIAPEEYVFAALVLNLDIITIYPIIVAIFGVCRNKKEVKVNDTHDVTVKQEKVLVIPNL